MSNTLNDLAADLYLAADIVGREQIGFIPSVSINRGSEQAALNDTVRSFATRKPLLRNDYAPSMTLPEGDDQIIDNKTMTINKVARVMWNWTGEEVAHVDNGNGFQTILGDQVLQAMRTIANQIEGDVGAALDAAASRAYGVAGTTPFATNLNEVAQMRKILADNGTPMDSQNTLVINSDAGVNMRNLNILQQVNTSGSNVLLRQGTLQDLQGFMIKESAGVTTHVKGTGTGYLVNNSGGYAVGATAIAVDTGTGTIVAGDVITFAADTVNKYVVESFANSIVTIAPTGLRVAIPDNNAITINNNHTSNIAFNKSAVELAIRAPKAPPVSAAQETMIVQDPFTGLSFNVSIYGGFEKSLFSVSSIYGIKVWKPDFVAKLLG